MIRLILISILLTSCLVANVFAEVLVINGTEFKIQDELKAKYPELIKLILATESMDNDERQYWFDIMPYMTDSQIDRIFNILETERKKLGELEIKYQKEIKELNDKHIPEWRSFQYNYVLENEGIALHYAKRVDYLGNSFMLKKYSNEEDSISRGELVDLKNLVLLSNKNILTLSDQMNLIEYSGVVIANLKKYIDIYGEEDVSEFIEHVNYIAIKYDDIGFLDEVVLKIERGEIPFIKKSSEAYIKFLYYCKRDEHQKALDLYESALDERLKSINEGGNEYYWVTSLVAMANLLPIEARTEYSQQSRLILAKYFDLVFKDYSSLDKAVRKGRAEARFIVLDIVNFLYSDMLTRTQKQLIDAFISKNRGSKEYYANDDDWYLQLTNSYFNGEIEKLYIDYKHNIDTRTQRGYKLDGVIMESGTYYAFNLFKNERYNDSINALNHIQLFGISFKSPARGYIEKEIAEAIKLKANERTSLNWIVSNVLEALKRADAESIVYGFAAGCMAVLYILFVLFPHWRIFRVKALRNNFTAKLILIPVSQILIKRIFKYCLVIKFPKIPFIPLTYRISRKEFIDRYIQVNLLNSNEYVDAEITRNIINNGINKVCLYGEGGMGKTLAAYKVAFNMAEHGYLPVMLDALVLPSEIDEVSISALIGEYYGDVHILSILAILGFTKYCFIIDNFAENNAGSLLKSLHGIYPNSIALFTSRSNSLSSDFDLSINLNSSTVDFEKYIKSRLDNRINAYKSFILEIKNILLISIISNNEIDITDIVREGSNDNSLEDQILKRYIDYQINSICSKYLSNIKSSHSTYLIEKMLCILAKSKSGRSQVEEFVNNIDVSAREESYLNQIFTILENQTAYKTKIQVMDLVENSAIIYTNSSRKIMFTHDLIAEHLIKRCQFGANK